jgi:D-lactate dehydrogenase (cytochrome)
MLDDKIKDILDAKADLVVTSNTGCHMQLISGLRRANLGIKVMHIAEVLDASYQGAGEGHLRKPTGQKPQPVGVNHPVRWLAWLEDQRKYKPENTDLASLKAILEPGQVIDDPVELLVYAQDASIERGTPMGVVYPYHTEDVKVILRWAKEHHAPVMARGAGTSLSGGAVPHRGELVIHFSHMDEILNYHPTGRSAAVQPGVVNLKITEKVSPEGLYFPPDPASGRVSTIGGNISTNAGGPHCFKYGVTTNYITGMEVVLADGTSVRMGGKAYDYPGIDLMGLMTGNEGTLGIVTEATLRLLKNPPAQKTMLVGFESVEHAGETVSAIIAKGLIPATMEMMDQTFVRIIEGYSHAGLPVDAAAVLIIEVDGYHESVSPQMDEIEQVLIASGVTDIRVAKTEEERALIWESRKSAAGSIARIAPSYHVVDGTVPRSKLAQCLKTITEICKDLDLPVGFLLHAGDGNLHPTLFIENPGDQEYMKRVKEGGMRLSELFVALGGTITGEHGVAIEKRNYMSLMYQPEELSMMQEIKEIFDPDGLLNPDKVLPSGITFPGVNGEGLIEVETVCQPASTQEAAEVIKTLESAGQKSGIRGGGTKSDSLVRGWSEIDTSKLSGVKTLALEDQYVTVGAGTRYSELNDKLSHEGLMVPLASPWDQSTIGGIVATNFNAPKRMLYGGVRDLVLALTAVLPDGRIIRAGRPLMKNVAGYDLAKLFIGSYGTIGLITDVSFKLMPLPRAATTYAVQVDDLATGMRLGSQLLGLAMAASSVLFLSGVDLPEVSSERALLYTVEGLKEDVDAELGLVRKHLASLGYPPPTEIDGTGTDRWCDWMQSSIKGKVLMRMGLPPGELPQVISKELAEPLEGGEFITDFASGLVYICSEESMDVFRKTSLSHGGYSIIIGGDPEKLNGYDRWGYTPESLHLMRSLKDRWDPQGIFNPHSFIL